MVRLGELRGWIMRIQIRTIMLATLLLGFSTLAAAQSREAIDVASLGPQIGERVPDFNLPDQSGQVHSLDSIMGPNGVMLVFFRSADW
jgi:cytochrome oxidase Cu insertion factor (SCO1/SenC/PrrC family)